MTEYKKTYKGRMTIRAGNSEDRRNGAKIFDPKPGTTTAKLEGA